MSSLVSSQSWPCHPRGPGFSVIIKQDVRGDGIFLFGFREPLRSRD